MGRSKQISQPPIFPWTNVYIEENHQSDYERANTPINQIVIGW